MVRDGHQNLHCKGDSDTILHLCQPARPSRDLHEREQTLHVYPAPRVLIQEPLHRLIQSRQELGVFACQGPNLVCTRVNVVEGYANVEAQTFMLGPSRTPHRGFSIEQISIVSELVVQLNVRVLKWPVKKSPYAKR